MLYLEFFKRGRLLTFIPNDVDIIVALHACDTATDDSIYWGIKNNVQVIVTAPCCHKEIRKQIDSKLSTISNSDDDSDIADILRHNIFRERQSEMVLFLAYTIILLLTNNTTKVTDSIRALILDYAGYDTSVFEFIGGEHTAKNVMITAVKRNNSNTNSDTNNDTSILQRILSLSSKYGIHQQKLAALMNIQLTTSTNTKITTKVRKLKPL
jgi:hypothetical protein